MNARHPGHRDRGRRRARRLAAGLTVGLAVVAPLVAACGGGSNGPRAQSGSSSPGPSATPDPLAFARCMRSHGVTDYPDSGGPAQASPGSDLDPGNPAYQRARSACQPLMPRASLDPSQAAQAHADDLAFARCMRQHGITNYPDPDPHGGPNGHGGVDLRGIDQDSPRFTAAQQACRQYQDPYGKGR